MWVEIKLLCEYNAEELENDSGINYCDGDKRYQASYRKSMLKTKTLTSDVMTRS